MVPAPDAHLALQLGILFAAAMVAGAMNALAGGGTVFGFPALRALGVPPLLSNATNALCVTPGHALAAVVYKREIARAPRRIITCTIAAGAGAVGGAWLLTITHAQTFATLAPWLLLAATLMFAFGPAVQKAMRRLAAAKPQPAVTDPNAVGNNL